MGEYDIDFAWWLDEEHIHLHEQKWNAAFSKFRSIVNEILKPYDFNIDKGYDSEISIEKANELFHSFRNLILEPPLNKRPAHSVKRMEEIKKLYIKNKWEWPENPEYYFRYMHSGYYENPPEFEIKRWLWGDEEPEEWQGPYGCAFKEPGWYIQFSQLQTKNTELENKEGIVNWKPDLLQIIFINKMEVGRGGEAIGDYNSWVEDLEFTIYIGEGEIGNPIYYDILTDYYMNAPWKSAKGRFVEIIKIDPEKIINYHNLDRPYSINFKENPIK